jgi:hypothetical protein
MISFDIKSFKEEVKKNLEKTRDRVLRFFRTKIKQIIDDGERVYNELKVKMNIQADCVDNYIDLSDFLNSDELTLSIENLKETFIKCEGFLQILEGNFSPLEIKQVDSYVILDRPILEFIHVEQRNLFHQKPERKRAE